MLLYKRLITLIIVSLITANIINDLTRHVSVTSGSTVSNPSFGTQATLDGPSGNWVINYDQRIGSYLCDMNLEKLLSGINLSVFKYMVLEKLDKSTLNSNVQIDFKMDRATYTMKFDVKAVAECLNDQFDEIPIEIMVMVLCCAVNKKTFHTFDVSKVNRLTHPKFCAFLDEKLKDINDGADVSHDNKVLKKREKNKRKRQNKGLKKALAKQEASKQATCSLLSCVDSLIRKPKIVADMITLKPKVTVLTISRQDGNVVEKSIRFSISGQFNSQASPIMYVPSVVSQTTTNNKQCIIKNKCANRLCYICRKKGHYAKSCPTLLKDKNINRKNRLLHVHCLLKDMHFIDSIYNLFNFKVNDINHGGVKINSKNIIRIINQKINSFIKNLIKSGKNFGFSKSGLFNIIKAKVMINKKVLRRVDSLNHDCSAYKLNPNKLTRKVIRRDTYVNLIKLNDQVNNLKDTKQSFVDNVVSQVKQTINQDSIKSKFLQINNDCASSINGDPFEDVKTVCTDYLNDESNDANLMSKREMTESQRANLLARQPFGRGCRGVTKQPFLGNFY